VTASYLVILLEGAITVRRRIAAADFHRRCAPRRSGALCRLSSVHPEINKLNSSPARNPICCRRTRRRSEIAWRCLANTLEIYDCQPQDVYNVHLGQQGRNIRWSRALRTRRCCCADSAPPPLSCDRQHLSYGGYYYYY